jgi:hypothetical protein
VKAVAGFRPDGAGMRLKAVKASINLLFLLDFEA